MKKGFTLAELVIALLLLAILSTVIVSFSITINANITNFQNVVETTDDMAFLKEMVVQWVSHFDNSQYSLSTDSEKIVATDRDDPTAQYCLFLRETTVAESNGYEVIAQYENWEGRYPTKSATRVYFFSTTVNGNTLIKCNVQYVSSNVNNKEKYENFAFTVGTRVQKGEAT